MTLSRDAIRDVIKQALDDMAMFIDTPFEFSDSLELVGPDGVLDSLNMMTFATKLEDLLEEKNGSPVPVLGDDAFSGESNPFQTVASLAAFIETQAGLA